jgi:hypothetical protein
MKTKPKTLEDLLDALEDAAHMHELAGLLEDDHDYQSLEDVLEIFQELYPDRYENAVNLAYADAEEMGVEFEEEDE